MNDRGKPRPLIGKFNTARMVDAPYRASAGTSISPIESRSILTLGRVDIVITVLIEICYLNTMKANTDSSL